MSNPEERAKAIKETEKFAGRWRTLMSLEHTAVAKTQVRIESVKLLFRGTNSLAVLNGTCGEGPMVAFVSGSTPWMAVLQAARLLQSDKLEWKQDEWKMNKLQDEEEGL